MGAGVVVVSVFKSNAMIEDEKEKRLLWISKREEGNGKEK